MKICFRLIKTNSGNDVYFEHLARALHNAGIESEFQYFSHYYQYFPLLLLLNRSSPTDADIIHTNIEFGWALKVKRKPLVSTVHHLVFDKYYQRFTSVYQKFFHYLVLLPNMYFTLLASDKVISVSKYTDKSLKLMFKYKNSQMIYNSIDRNTFIRKEINKYNDGKIHLLYVGNMINRKGSDLLPKLMIKLGDQYVLNYTSGLRTTKKCSDFPPNMISLGKISETELVDQYNRCDALLFPTRLEGFGYAVVEALSCGTPVLCSNNSSLTEIITDERMFIDIDPEINANQIKNKLRLKYRFNRNDLAKFSTKQMVDTYINMYNQLL
jgi:glycosyltransferase involved in cell wall biosynthesis